jgi:hypothetical protein
MKSNRLMVQEQRQTYTQKVESGSLRKAHTRTKIQLGGLLAKTGILERFSINIGDDLQDDAENQDNAAALVGCIKDLLTQLPNPIPDTIYHAFMQNGIRLFRTSNNNPSLK